MFGIWVLVVAHRISIYHIFILNLHIHSSLKSGGGEENTRGQEPKPGLHKTQNIKQNKKKKQIKRTTRSPESVVFVFSFSRPPVFGGNIQRYVTMASIPSQHETGSIRM